MKIEYNLLEKKKKDTVGAPQQNKITCLIEALPRKGATSTVTGVYMHGLTNNTANASASRAFCEMLAVITYMITPIKQLVMQNINGPSR